MLGLRRGQRALRAARGLGRQLGRRARERRRPPPGPRAPAPGRPSARARAATSSSRLGRRVRAVPGAAIGIDLRIGRLRQRPVRAPALLRGCRPVDRRAHERMTKPHPRAELEQTRLGRRRRRLGADPEPLGRAPQQHRLADRLGRRDQQQPLRLRRERLEPPPEALLDPTRQSAARPACPNPPASSAASARAAAPAAPADCRASRRRSGRAPARPAAPG